MNESIGNACKILAFDQNLLFMCFVDLFAKCKFTIRSWQVTFIPQRIPEQSFWTAHLNLASIPVKFVEVMEVQEQGFLRKSIIQKL